MAAVDKAQKDGIPRSGQVVAEDELAEAGADMDAFRWIGCGVLAITEDPKEPAFLAAENATLDEAVDRGFVDILLANGQVAQPEHDGPGLRGGMEMLQPGVQQFVTGTRRVNDGELVQVSVDATGERQIEDDRAGKPEPQGIDGKLEPFAGLLIQRQQSKFFHEG